MADNQDQTEEVIDGYDGSDSGSGGTINAGGTKLTTDSFDVNFALAGGVLYAKKTDGKYYVATDFKRNTDNRFYPYTAKVENKTHQFDINGQTSQGLYTLYTTTGVIYKNDKGDYVPQGDDESRIGYYIPEMNYRENVAVNVLNALIGHVPDPLAYKQTTINLLVKKAFEFAEEFTNQAMAFRDTNATKSGSGSSEHWVPEKSPTEKALDNISDMITELKSAFISGEGSSPVTMIDKISELAESTDTIKQALVYSDGSNDPVGIAEVVHDGDAAIASALGTTNSRLGTVITTLQSTNDTLGDIETGTFTRLDTANGKLAEIDSNTEDIEVEVSIDQTTIENAINSAYRLDVIDRELGHIDDNVAEINGKIGSGSGS